MHENHCKRLYGRCFSKRSCPVNLWNQAKENSKGKDRMSVELNHYLEIACSRIHQIYRELESAGKIITIDDKLKHFTIIKR